MKFNLLIIVVIPILMSGCATQLSLESATVQEWVGGAAGSGGGSKYVVTVNKKGGKQVNISSVWIGNREKGVMAKANIFTGNRMVNKISADMEQFRLEMSLTNRRRQGRDDPGGVVGEQPANPNLPEEFKKGIIIRYTDHKGKEGQLIVQDLKRLEPLILP